MRRHINILIEIISIVLLVMGIGCFVIIKASGIDYEWIPYWLPFVFIGGSFVAVLVWAYSYKYFL